jgi:hypothetical protein
MTKDSSDVDFFKIGNTLRNGGPLPISTMIERFWNVRDVSVFNVNGCASKSYSSD